MVAVGPDARQAPEIGAWWRRSSRIAVSVSAFRSSTSCLEVRIAGHLQTSAASLRRSGHQANSTAADGLFGAAPGRGSAPAAQAAPSARTQRLCPSPRGPAARRAARASTSCRRPGRATRISLPGSTRWSLTIWSKRASAATCTRSACVSPGHAAKRTSGRSKRSGMADRSGAAAASVGPTACRGCRSPNAEAGRQVGCRRCRRRPRRRRAPGHRALRCACCGWRPPRS